MSAKTNDKTNWLKKVGPALLKRAGMVVLVLVGASVGFLVHAAVSPSGPAVAAGAGGSGGDTTVEYTCSMHPQIRLEDPNAKCPICGMDLIPVDTGQGGAGSLREYSVSPESAALMDIQVERVRRRFVTADIRMVGKLDYDETTLAYITSWMPGRLDRLYIDYTGIPVKKGDHLVSIYSPELFSAQEVLLDALATVKRLTDQSPQLQRDFAQDTLNAARGKLRLLGLADERIAAVEASGKVSDHLTITSPASGIVIHKDAKEGMYVSTGTRIYTIADLTTMWVKLDAYESDLMWLRYGQKVHFTTEAYPGETFTGTITFIDPILTDRTRTIKVRLIVPNAEGRLKPGMFVRAVVSAQVAAGGKVMDASLAGKWISRHHPEIIKDGPGTCDICGIPLVPTESLGYVSADSTTASKPLVIPVTAALVTGTRAVVYVQIDPSLLQMDTVADWPGLIADVKSHLKAPPPGEGRFVNTTCPVMGGMIDPKNVTASLTREFDGHTVAFCCDGCPQKWDAMSDAEKTAKIAAITGGKLPLAVFWSMLSADLRKGLLAVKADQHPDAGLQHRFKDEVNVILARRDLATAAAWPNVGLPTEAFSLLHTGPANLPPLKITRLNRLLLAVLFPKAIPTGNPMVAFEGRQIVLGPRARDHYLVRSGLAEGEWVVTRGNFKIDSALQIMAKPSMMGLGGGAPDAGHAGHGGGDMIMPEGKPDAKGAMEVSAIFKHKLGPVLSAGDGVKAAVKAGDLAGIRLALAKIAPAVKAVDATTLKAKASLVWKELAMRLTNDGVEGASVKTPDEVRRIAGSLQDNIAALRSQMQVGHAGHAKPAPVGAAFAKQLGALYAAYFTTQSSLAADKFDDALAAAVAGKAALAKVDMKLVTGKDHVDWMEFAAALDKVLTTAAGATDIKILRTSFALYSDQMFALATRFGPPVGGETYQMRCPMAFNDRGAIWLQDNKDLRNPYYGSTMLKCGSIQKVLSAPAEDEKKDIDHGAHDNH